MRHACRRFAAALQASALPHGHGTNLAEALCGLPLSMDGDKPRCLVLYDAPGADRLDGEHTVYGDLLWYD